MNYRILEDIKWGIFQNTFKLTTVSFSLNKVVGCEWICDDFKKLHFLSDDNLIAKGYCPKKWTPHFIWHYRVHVHLLKNDYFFSRGAKVMYCSLRRHMVHGHWTSTKSTAQKLDCGIHQYAYILLYQCKKH